MWLHLPFPPSLNHANRAAIGRDGKPVIYASEAKKAFFKQAFNLFLTQKKRLQGQRIKGPFHYCLILNQALRTPSSDGDNRVKYCLDFAQDMELIDNDRLAEAGTWMWGRCEHGAMLIISRDAFGQLPNPDEEMQH